MSYPDIKEFLDFDEKLKTAFSHSNCQGLRTEAYFYILKGTIKTLSTAKDPSLLIEIIKKKNEQLTHFVCTRFSAEEFDFDLSMACLKQCAKQTSLEFLTELLSLNQYALTKFPKKAVSLLESFAGFLSSYIMELKSTLFFSSRLQGPSSES